METKRNPYFSIVMPTYGVEQYIADALADILTQTCRDFELIVVDDCTLDRSIEVVSAVCGNDPRVRIVHHEQNRGLSQARNTGIAQARGSWLLFPDPDDRYDAHLLERVQDAAKQHEPDLIVFAHVQEYYDASGKHLYDNPIALRNSCHLAGPALGRAAVSLEQQTHLGYAWNKAYRTDIINGYALRFEDDVPLIEDILFNVAYLRHTSKVVTISDELYWYAKRLSANLTSKFIANYYELHRRRIQEIRDFAQESGALDDDAKATLGALYGRFILSAIEQNSSRESGMNHEDRVAWLCDVFQDPLFGELVTRAKATDSASLAACLELLNTRSIPALLALGRVIHVVRANNTTLYTKVKSRR